MILAPLLQLGLLFGMSATEPEDATVYAPRGKRDPFASRSTELQSSTDTLSAPLRKLAISEVVIVGTAVGRRGGFALVQGPDRLTHLASVKSRFADGHLVGISGDWVIFRVDGTDTDRTWVTRRTRSFGE